MRVANLRKTYEAAHQPYVALDGVDVEIVEGEFFCLLGPSGCGKSTLLNILAGFEPATGGSVTSDGTAITGAGRDRVMFFQDAGSALFPWLTRRGKRALRPARAQGAQARSGRYHRQVSAHGRSRPASQQVSRATVRRHAAAVADRARARGRAGSPADGRAVRRARRADPPPHACRAAVDLGAHRQDRRVRHPRYRRGDPARPIASA